MAWTTEVGYPETITDGEAWHYLQRALGRSDGIPYVSSLQITAVAGRVPRLSTGGVASAGVYSEQNAITNMPALPELTSGSRYWCIVVRRTYGATPAEHTTTFAAVGGTSAPSVPDLQRVEGSVWDTPLWLVRVRAGQSLFDDIHDLRVIAETPGVYTIYDDLALPFIDHPGAQVYNATSGMLWARVYAANKARTWLPVLTHAQNAKVSSTNAVGSRGNGWIENATNWTSARWTHGMNTIQLKIQLRRQGGVTVPVNASGGMGDQLLYTVKEDFRPLERVIGSLLYYSANRATYSGLVTLETDGRVVMRAGSPNVDIVYNSNAQATGQDGKSVEASFTYLSKSS